VEQIPSLEAGNVSTSHEIPHIFLTLMVCWCSHKYLLCPHIRTIFHSPQLFVTFHNMLLLGGEWLLVTCPTSKLDVCLLLAFHDWLFIFFTTALYQEASSVHAMAYAVSH